MNEVRDGEHDVAEEADVFRLESAGILAVAVVDPNDGDGIYDPRQINDRLRDSSGTMSEFELGLLRQRAQEALRQKISSSAVLTEVPIGYLRTETNGIEKTRDREDAGSADAGGYRGSLLTVPAPWRCPPGVALVSAGKSSAV
jgi:hypothetical protein